MHTQLSELKYTIAGKTYEGIKLIRNQAKVTLEQSPTAASFQV